MTAAYACECGSEKGDHQGGTYWCRTPGCDCKRYTPDFQQAAPVMPGGESTSALLRQTQTALAASQADLTHAEQERDQLATAVAGWVARFHAAHEALAIDEFDGDSCSDLEDTIRYAVDAYRSVCEAEANAADRIDLLRAELASARAELEQLRARHG